MLLGYSEPEPKDTPPPIPSLSLPPVRDLGLGVPSAWEAFGSGERLRGQGAAHRE